MTAVQGGCRLARHHQRDIPDRNRGIIGIGEDTGGIDQLNQGLFAHLLKGHFCHGSQTGSDLPQTSQLEQDILHEGQRVLVAFLVEEGADLKGNADTLTCTVVVCNDTGLVRNLGIVAALGRSKHMLRDEPQIGVGPLLRLHQEYLRTGSNKGSFHTAEEAAAVGFPNLKHGGHASPAGFFYFRDAQALQNHFAVFHSMVASCNDCAAILSKRINQRSLLGIQIADTGQDQALLASQLSCILQLVDAHFIKGNMAFRQRPDPAVDFIIGTLPIGGTKHHHLRTADHIGKEVFMLGMEAESFLGRLKAGYIGVVIQMTHDVDAGGACVGQILPLAQFHQSGRYAGMAVTEAHEVHTGIVCGTLVERTGREAGITGSTVDPFVPVDFRVGFAANVINAVHGNFFADALDQCLHPCLVFCGAAASELHILADKGGIFDIVGFRHFCTVNFKILLFAAIAVARTVEITTVIHHQEAAHIAEYAVKGMGGQHLFQNLKHDLLLVFAVGADMDIAVVVDDLALCRAVGPFGMLLIQVVMDLGEVGTGNNPDTFFMASIDDLAQAVAGQIFTLGLIRMIRLIAGNDTGGVQCYHRSAEAFQLLGILFRVDVSHVDLAQIRLNHPPGIAFPPMFHRQFLAFWFLDYSAEWIYTIIEQNIC